MLEDRVTHQLWQERSTGRRYMAYPINETALAHPQMQLYGFRLLNQAHLVAVQRVLAHQPAFLCSEPNQRWALVDHLPLTACSFTRVLSLPEGLAVMQAALNGYHSLNYIYGPLFPAANHIHFTEEGSVRVWVNPNLALNQPQPLLASPSTPECLQ